MRSGALSGSVMNVSTSGRPSTQRWSLTSQVVPMSRSLKRTGRGTNGTGLAGSDTYSSKSPSPAAGAWNASLPPARRYSGLLLAAQPLSQLRGQPFRRSQWFSPVL
ncbi:hypothetical protein G6F58_012909 [Rhizopus delemar]|nr:hypothetical protein G6F58_012909 [Rhizopus delemar]